VREDNKMDLGVLSWEVLPLKLPMNGYFSHTGVGKLNCAWSLLKLDFPA